MPTSKRLSDKKDVFTLGDLAAWAAEALRIGIPPRAVVRANVTMRGRVREVWVSDDEIAPPSAQEADVPFPTDHTEPHDPTYDRPKFAGMFRGDPDLSEKAKEFRQSDLERSDPTGRALLRQGEEGVYIPRQQLSPGGPVHGGFTVILPEDQATPPRPEDDKT